MAPINIDERRDLYGEYAAKMEEGEKVRQDMIDRAAYVYVTGQFPSHLRSTYTGLLRIFSKYLKKPVSLDGRSGNIKLDPRVVQDLDLDNHPMVIEVRKRIAQGYFIQPSRGFGTRRNFWKVFMFKLANDVVTHPITVQGDGAIKEGWDD